MFISITVYMASYIYGCSRLLVGRTYPDEAGQLLCIVEVGKPSGGKNECRSERNADSFDGCQGFELLVELRRCNVSQFCFELFDLLGQKVNGFVQCTQTGFVPIRQYDERFTQIL